MNGERGDLALDSLTLLALRFLKRPFEVFLRVRVADQVSALPEGLRGAREGGGHDAEHEQYVERACHRW